MARSSGNVKLKTARQLAGFSTQQAFADELTRVAPQCGFSDMVVSERQVRRWESSKPPWPRGDHQTLLVHVLQLPVGELGFTPPWGDGAPATSAHVPASPGRAQATGSPGTLLPLPSSGVTAGQPASAGRDFSAITAAHRRLYWSVQPGQLHQTVVEHARLGTQLLSETSGVTRRVLAIALAESLLLAGRVEFFDLRDPEIADATFAQALQAAAEAEEHLLGSAILAHSAFVPGWAGRRSDAAERMRAARTYARRVKPSAEFLAWLNAVEAECETRCGQTRDALRLIEDAETILAETREFSSPDWFDWFNPVRLAAFKGNTQLKAGHLLQARETLTQALEGLPEGSGKQRVVVLADLAAVATAREHPEEACGYALRALDQLTVTWYATGMERIREVRASLAAWEAEPSVRQLDDRLYGWETTLSVLRR